DSVIQVTHGSSNRKAILGYGLVTSGSTATIAGTFSDSGGQGDSVIFALPVVGIGVSPTPVDTMTNSGTGTAASGSIDFVEAGLVVAVSHHNGTGTLSWTNITEQGDVSVDVSG